jgi:transglutaminase-like putative cysteine protease
MKYSIILFIQLAVLSQTLFAQEKLPVIKASSNSVNIRDGGKLIINAWNISPKIKPDVYITAVKNGMVTFYTDLDSISFRVKPHEVYSFLVLLNNKDTALTQIKYGKKVTPITYLDILKKAKKYDYSDTRAIPKFEYQTSENPNLVALRKEFKLDSIAGGGNEISKIINLLHWVHNLIPHDGSHENPVVKNAMSMITQCKKENRGLNCRGLAIVLNECYLSMGIKSRFITCMPKDSVFDDCHVINMVYSNDLQKWIWIDPTNNAYVMDEKGELLGIREVREKIINGQPLILNPDANWNNKISAVKEDYLYNYMAKNLYRMECPMKSEYNYESFQKGETVTYIELLPIDAYNQTPQKQEEISSHTGAKFINFKTNNPNIFWAKPE